MQQLIDKHVINLLQIKKTMKFRLRLTMTVVKEDVNADGETVAREENTTFSLRPDGVAKANPLML